MGKETKTNAMRILERAKVPYTAHEYAHLGDSPSHFAKVLHQ